MDGVNVDAGLKQDSSTLGNSAPRLRFLAGAVLATPRPQVFDFIGLFDAPRISKYSLRYVIIVETRISRRIFCPMIATKNANSNEW